MRAREGARRSAPAILCILLGFLASPLAAQVFPNPMVRFGKALAAPDTVTVGDRMRAVVALRLPPGTRVEGKVAPDPRGRVQGVGPVRVTPPDRRDPAHRLEATLVGWVADTLPPARIDVTVRYADGQVRYLAVRLDLPRVRSVLPADTAGLQPRPAKDVLGPGQDWRLLALLALAALLLIALVGWLLWRRRRRRPPAAAPAAVRADARTRALAALERARASGFAQAGNWSAFYALVSRALRRFAAETHAQWGMDLTTAELLARLAEDRIEPGRITVLARLLGRADLAKFARHRLSTEVAERDLADARRWVETSTTARSAPAAAEREEVGVP
ncbi:MAG TPA: DUF4381 family protein [Longimicrobiaceae bacterium]|nr:DUF4381 family protein [Longimicrobiaceae bacterium]